MVDQMSEVLLLSTTASQRVEVDKLEDKEHLSAPQQITLKCGDAFLVTDVRGDLLASRPEMGLYWQGTRFLRTCNLFLEGSQLVTLSHHIANMGDECQIDLTNTAFPLSQHEVVEQGAIPGMLFHMTTVN